MTKAEEFVKDCTRNCSNELIAIQDKNGSHVISYHEWITPEQALRAVEIEREEIINKACEWLKFNLQDYAGEDSCRNSVPFDKDVFDDFREAMKGGQNNEEKNNEEIP